MMFDPGKWLLRIRIGLSSEQEVKYNQLNAAAEAAAEAVKNVEKIDKLKAKSKSGTLVSKICQCCETDLTDMLS